jgi:hypothetical protein
MVQPGTGIQPKWCIVRLSPIDGVNAPVSSRFRDLEILEIEDLCRITANHCHRGKNIHPRQHAPTSCSKHNIVCS